MNKIFSKTKFFIVLVFLLAFSSVKAAGTCDYNAEAALIKDASKVKAVYEIREYSTSDEGCLSGDCLASKGFSDISVLNVSENLKIVISNDQNSDSFTVLGANLEDGVYNFSDEVGLEVLTYKIDIYASDSSDCRGKKLGSQSVVIPRFNGLAYSKECRDNPGYYMCQKYVTYDLIEYDIFKEKINEYVEKGSKGDGNPDKTSIITKILTVLATYKIPLIIIAIVCVVTVILITVIKRKRRVL